MLSKTDQEQVLRDLYKTTKIRGVYFHKDILWIENEYDIPDVEAFLSQSKWGVFVRYQHCKEELMAW